MVQGLSVLGIRAWGGQHRTVSHEERIFKIQLGCFVYSVWFASAARRRCSGMGEMVKGSTRERK